MKLYTIAWVIEDATGENGSPPLYWSGVGRWSYVNLDAIRFARQIDAERVASGIAAKVRVAEHMWTLGPASADHDGEC